MTKNQISKCAGLPVGMWWFITLFGLMLLCLLAIIVEQKQVESDLERRVGEAMTAGKIDWISVDLERRGRDVLLTGTAPSAESHDLAVEMAENVFGVRVVHDQVDIRPPLVSPELSIKQHGGRVLLGGRLQSQATIDEVVNTARETYGNENVINELVLSGEVKTANWLAAYAGILPTLAGMKAVHLDISDSKSQLTAEVESQGERLQLVYAARKLLGDNLDADIAVVAPPKPVLKPNSVVKPQTFSAPQDTVLKACQSKLDDRMKDGKILFATNTAELDTISYSLLDQIVSVLEQCSKAVSKNSLIIAGHTDSLGDDGYNLELSQRRADAVKAYIVNTVTGVGRISSIGYGESRPVESNDTDQGRTQNRRIEFKLEQN